MRLRSSKSAPNISSLSRDLETSPKSELETKTNPFFIKPDPGLVRPPTEEWNPPEVVYSLVHNDFRFAKRNCLFAGGKLRNIFRPLALPVLTRSFRIPYYGDFPARTVTLPPKVWILRTLIGDYRVLWVEHEAFGLDVVRKVERERERRVLRERRREREEKRRKMLSMISERSFVGECESPFKGEGGEGSGESEKGEKGDETIVKAEWKREVVNSKE